MNAAARRGAERLAGLGVRWGYATNAHPSETVDELQSSLERYAAAVRRALAIDDTLGVELRLGAPGIEELAASSARCADLARTLDRAGLVAFTANAFPLGRFTTGVVKTGVYEPSWTSPERARLTVALARALVLVTSVDPLTISTLGGAYRPREDGEEARRAMRKALVHVALELEALESKLGRRVVLALEPEPFTTLETADDALDFFGALFDDPRRERLARHLALNLDVCHQSVVFEDPTRTLARWSGLPVAKVHVSAALRVPEPCAAALAVLARYDEPRYLHQSFLKSHGRVQRWADLDEFLEAVRDRDFERTDEARVHFHVPLHAPPAAPLASTANDAARLIGALVAGPTRPAHWVVETYTWDVLRGRGLAADDELATGIARELEWMLEQVGGA